MSPSEDVPLLSVSYLRQVTLTRVIYWNFHKRTGYSRGIDRYGCDCILLAVFFDEGKLFFVLIAFHLQAFYRIVVGIAVQTALSADEPMLC